LKDRINRIDELRANDTPTVPSTLSEELATNPFLRAGDPGIQDTLGMIGADAVDVFAEIRSRKDRF